MGPSLPLLRQMLQLLWPLARQAGCSIAELALMSFPAVLQPQVPGAQVLGLRSARFRARRRLERDRLPSLGLQLVVGLLGE